MKNGSLGKTGPQGLKTLPFFSSNIKDNVEAIHFRRGVQGHVFVQITFENCSLNFYFENGKIVITSMEHFYMLTDFYAASF